MYCLFSLSFLADMMTPAIFSPVIAFISSPLPDASEIKNVLGKQSEEKHSVVKGMALPDSCVIPLFPVFGVLQGVPIRNRQCWWGCVILWWAPFVSWECSRSHFPGQSRAGVVGEPSPPWPSRLGVQYQQCFLPFIFSVALGDASLLPFLAVSPFFPPKEASELFAPVFAGRLLLMDYWESFLCYFFKRECGFF